MGRYKKSYGLSWITILIFLIPINLYSYKEIDFLSYIDNNSVKKLDNINESEIFIYFDSTGGKISSVLDILKLMELKQKKGIKFYSIIDNQKKSLATSFLINLYSDIVFYVDTLNIGASISLSKESYNKYKIDLDYFFKKIAIKNGVKKEDIKFMFLNGDFLNFDKLNNKNSKTKFIKIQNLEDITYSIPSYKISKKSNILKHLHSYEFIYIIFNLLILLSFTSVYFSKNIILRTIAFIMFFIFINFSSKQAINNHSLFSIIFSHFILIFKNFTKLNYILLIASSSIFLLSSVFFLNPFDIDFYIDDYGINLIIIAIIYTINLIYYRLGFTFFSKRLKNFNKSNNDLINKKAIVISNSPLIIKFNKDKFSAYSIDKLEIGEDVKIIAFKNLDLIVERI